LAKPLAPNLIILLVFNIDQQILLKKNKKYKFGIRVIRYYAILFLLDNYLSYLCYTNLLVNSLYL
jgi:hypothetical protein